MGDYVVFTAGLSICNMGFQVLLGLPVNFPSHLNRLLTIVKGPACGLVVAHQTAKTIR